jgi:hypothetical protein
LAILRQQISCQNNISAVSKTRTKFDCFVSNATKKQKKTDGTITASELIITKNQRLWDISKYYPYISLEAEEMMDFNTAGNPTRIRSG